MKKAELIAEFLAQPIKRGDAVYVPGSGNRRKLVTVDSISLADGMLRYRDADSRILSYDYALISVVERSVRHIGQNPMKDGVRVRASNKSLDGILHQCGFSTRNLTWRELESYNRFGDKNAPELNWNPFVEDWLGKPVEYQRPLCWTLDQKQSLIESVYCGIDLGKIIFRVRSYAWVKKMTEAGISVGFNDVVDGKQRLSTLIEFIQDGFADSNGVVFSEFSGEARHKFLDYSNISFGQLPEDATDQDTLATFMMLNHAGQPMTQEHLDFVKSIRPAVY